tara:strand:- start:1029 stop:2108 length:1080 start_codon:yes stop_codon:yes gene_type:complete
MYFLNKLNKLKKIYSIVIIFVLFLNTFFFNKLHANSFHISDIEIHEEFGLNFHKTKVFEKAFKAGFIQLISMVTTFENKQKLENTKIATIKSLIDSFEVSDEKFVKDEYIAKFNVNFNKKNTLNFFEKKNIFPSIPNKLDVLMIPILINVNEEKLMIFNDNPFYENWNTVSGNHYLLNYILPNEDIEDRNFLKSNLESLEEYNFFEIINKYEMSNYVINIIYQNNKILKVFSKIQLNGNLKIINQSFKDININKKDSLIQLIKELKNTYEDSWKNLNIINTSIKLPIRVLLYSKENEKIRLFENTLNNLYLVSNYNIISFDSNEVVYKIIYNGSPKKFLSEIKKNNLNIEKDNQNWRIK